jgi:hypothetical protein
MDLLKEEILGAIQIIEVSSNIGFSIFRIEKTKKITYIQRFFPEMQNACKELNIPFKF